MFKPLTAIFAILLAFAMPVSAAEEFDAAAFEATLNYRDGKIPVADGNATLNLPAGYRYLDESDAQRVLEKAWGNVPDRHIKGLIVPAKTSVFADGSWGVTVMYERHGHVDDAGAGALDADQLLKGLKEKDEARNARRKRQGFEPITLVGWAEPPHYDKAAHTLFWGEEMKFGTGAENTLNYNVRILGRGGVLMLNAIAPMSQLPHIRSAMREVAAFSTFDAGQRYADFNGAFDEGAYWGVDELIKGDIVYISKSEKMWANLRHFNLKYILIILFAVGYVAYTKRHEIAVFRARMRQR